MSSCRWVIIYKLLNCPITIIMAATTTTTDWDFFGETFSIDVCRALSENGYTVIDNAFPRDVADALADEIEWVAREKDLMKQHYFAFRGKQFPKPRIREVDLHHGGVRGRLPMFDSLFNVGSICMGEALSNHLPDYGLIVGPQGTTIKLQHNAGGGGCFPVHYDNPGRPNKRKVTCVMYLNRNWKEGDGGEIQLTPFLNPPPVRIEPIHNRMAVFSSDSMLHRVLPAVAERYCFSIWIDGAFTNSDSDVLLKAKHLDVSGGVERCVELLRSSALQRQLSRPVYAEAYESSLRECMRADLALAADAAAAAAAAAATIPPGAKGSGSGSGEGEGKGEGEGEGETAESGLEGEVAEGLQEMLAEHSLVVAKAAAHPLLDRCVTALRAYLREQEKGQEQQEQEKGQEQQEQEKGQEQQEQEKGQEQQEQGHEQAQEQAGGSEEEGSEAAVTEGGVGNSGRHEQQEREGRGGHNNDDDDDDDSGEFTGDVDVGRVGLFDGLTSSDDEEER